MPKLWVFAAISILCAQCGAWEPGFEDTATADDLPTGVKYTGKILVGKKWTDNAGTHLFLISGNQTGQFCEPGYRSELHAYEYIQSDSSAELLWHIRDFGENECSNVNLLPGSLTIIDVDGDSIAETCFRYEIGHDCCDPLTVKLMLHHNGRKLAIRGKVPMTGNLDEYTKDFDKAFKQAPHALRKYASESWDRTIGKHYELD